MRLKNGIKVGVGAILIPIFAVAHHWGGGCRGGYYPHHPDPHNPYYPSPAGGYYSYSTGPYYHHPEPAHYPYYPPAQFQPAPPNSGEPPVEQGYRGR